MNPNITAFAELLVNNPTLQEKLTQLDDQTSHAVAEKMASLSAEAGTPFTADEYLNALTELTDDDLQAVAGGLWRPSAGNIIASILLPAGCGIVALSSLAHKGDADKCQPDLNN